MLRKLGRPGLPDAETPADERNTWIFYLGPDGLHLDDESLHVIFDGSGRAAMFSVSQG